MFFASGGDDVVLTLLKNRLRRLEPHGNDVGAFSIDRQAALKLLTAVSGQKRELYKELVDRPGKDEIRRHYGGTCYLTQRDVAEEVFKMLQNRGVLHTDAAACGAHNILIDSRLDKEAQFGDIDIVNDADEVDKLRTYVPSVERLGDDFKEQACRIRVFVDPLALKEEYRSKASRAEVGKMIVGLLEPG
jgi:hypothetical protein